MRLQDQRKPSRVYSDADIDLLNNSLVSDDSPIASLDEESVYERDCWKW
jgi:hypothetical protein